MMIVKEEQINLKKLNKLIVIGRGGFGRVWFWTKYVGMEGGSKEDKKILCIEGNV